MRDRSIDEFEALFERASIPVLDIHEVSLDQVSVVLSGGPLDRSVVELAANLNTRFGASFALHHANCITPDQVRGAVDPLHVQDGPKPFASTAELIGQISIARSQLVLLADAQRGGAASVDLDELVEATGPPILIVRKPIGDADAVFTNILHSLTGNFRQTQNFAYSFTLASQRGNVRLLHTIRDAEIQDVADSLRLSTGITEGAGEALLKQLAHHGERYLRAVVTASKPFAFDVSYHLAVGNVDDAVRRELQAARFGLLVVGSHHEGRSHVTSDDYRLMHQVRDIPVLAL